MFSNFYPGINTPGIIARTNIDGNLIEIFYAPFNVSKYSSFRFNVYDFYLFSDQSFITAAGWSYYQGEFGVSDASLTDLCFIKIDSSRNFKWSTSIDFFNLYEERESMYEYNNTLYVAIVSARYYYWLLTLKQDTGVFDKWNWVYSFKGSFDIEYHELVITYASKQSIYAYGNSMNFTTINYYSLFLFDPITLKLKIIYSLIYWNKFYGFHIVELNSDAMYWVSNNKFAR